MGGGGGGGSQRLLSLNPTTVMVVLLLGLWLLFCCDNYDLEGLSPLIMIFGLIPITKNNRNEDKSDKNRQ